jgi:asparagine synthase (glutamine-hydrolysing)
LSGAAIELDERLDRAVRQRLIADVPLGAFLSGGLDSGAMVAHMAMASNTAVKTCTIGFGESAFDERSYAQAVAARYHTDHLETVTSLNAATAGEAVDLVVSTFDEPFADSSAIPTFHVCRLARDRVTVALSGDGGDEAFGGYRRYLWHCRENAVRAILPQCLRGPLFGAIAALYPQLDYGPRWLRARATSYELSLDSVDAYLNNVACIPGPIRKSIVSARFRSALQGHSTRALFEQLMADAPASDPLLQAQYVDIKTWLPGRMLVKVDRASMAHGLEVRSPFLDPELMEWALALPSALKCHGGAYKIVLRKSLEPILPAALLRRPKQGFAIPLRAWLRGPLRLAAQAALSSPALLDTGWFEATALARLGADHFSGRRDHAASIWAIMVLERFLARG